MSTSNTIQIRDIVLHFPSTKARDEAVARLRPMVKSLQGQAISHAIQQYLDKHKEVYCGEVAAVALIVNADTKYGNDPTGRARTDVKKYNLGTLRLKKDQKPVEKEGKDRVFLVDAPVGGSRPMDAESILKSLS